MAAGQQSNPPSLGHVAPPWFIEWVRRLLIWLIGIRPVQGVGIEITDAPGGGSLISCNIRVLRALGQQVGFGWHPSPHIGGGDPPANQGLRIRLIESVINENIVPDNMASEFLLLDNKAVVYLRCTTTQEAGGNVISALIDVTDTLAPDPLGSLDVAPATSARALWKFKTAGGKIISSSVLRIGGLEVSPRVTGVTCGQVKMRMSWGTLQAADGVKYLDEVT